MSDRSLTPPATGAPARLAIDPGVDEGVHDRGVGDGWRLVAPHGPIDPMDRVGGEELPLDDAAKHRGRPRDLAIFLILPFTGLHRGSVAALRVRNPDWGLRAVRLKGEKTQGVPLPAVVTQFLVAYSTASSRARAKP